MSSACQQGYGESWKALTQGWGQQEMRGLLGRFWLQDLESKAGVGSFPSFGETVLACAAQNHAHTVSGSVSACKAGPGQAASRPGVGHRQLRQLRQTQALPRASHHHSCHLHAVALPVLELVINEAYSRLLSLTYVCDIHPWSCLRQ